MLTGVLIRLASVELAFSTHARTLEETSLHSILLGYLLEEICVKETV
jgi:hypothetical protein